MSSDFIQYVTSIIEANYSDENFGPEQLAKKLGISHSTLHRRIKKASGKTISHFIRDIRLEKASHLLLNEDSTISEIAYKVGFASVTYFNRCFHDRFGYAPGEYKKKEREKQNNNITKNRKSGLGIRWILLLALILVLITIFIFLNKKYSFWGSEKQTEKSIAVLPFTYSGDDKENEYLCKGIEHDILSDLSKIGDLTVVTIYNEATISPTKIRKQLNAAHLLDGTFYQNNNTCWLLLKLINTENNSVKWLERFDLSDKKIFSSEKELAQSIAKELHASITEEEILLIEKKPTLNPEANDFYLMGKDAHNQYHLDNTNKDALKTAENYYRKAITSDPKFAAAYTGLARVTFDRTTWSDIFKENYLDSVLELVNTALTIDNTLSDAFVLRGDYYREKDPDKVVAEYEQALRFDPNNWQAYYGLARYYLLSDDIKSLEYFLEAVKRYRGPEYKIMLSLLSFECSIYGLFDKASYYNQLVVEWDEDSANYYGRMAGIERYKGHYEKAIEFGLKAYNLDSSNIEIVGALSYYYVLIKDYKNALHFMKKAEKLATLMNFKRNNEHLRIGFVYLVNGDTIKSKEYFETQIEVCKEILKSSGNQSALYDLAATYSILNQKGKAYEVLYRFIDSDEIPWFFYVFITDDPLFDNIRMETEFQLILEEIKHRATTSRDSLKTWFEQKADF